MNFNWLKEIWKMHEPIWNGLSWKSADFWCMLGHGNFQVLVYFWFNHFRVHLHMLGTNWTPHVLAKKGQTRCIPRASLIFTFLTKWETSHSRKSVPCAREDNSPHHAFFTHSHSAFVSQNECKHCLNTKQNENGHHTCFGLIENSLFSIQRLSAWITTLTSLQTLYISYSNSPFTNTRTTLEEAPQNFLIFLALQLELSNSILLIQSSFLYSNTFIGAQGSYLEGFLVRFQRHQVNLFFTFAGMLTESEPWFEHELKCFVVCIVFIAGQSLGLMYIWALIQADLVKSCFWFWMFAVCFSSFWDLISWSMLNLWVWFELHDVVWYVNFNLSLISWILVENRACLMDLKWAYWNWWK